MTDVARHGLRMVTTRLLDRRSSIPHSWRAVLSEPLSAYALSSWCYCVCGLVGLAQATRCPGASPVGWDAAHGARECVLVILQGIWSYLSDVVAVGRVSWAHPVDRFSAVALTFFQAYKLGFLVRATMSWPELLWLAGGLGVGIFYKVADYHALLAGDALRYRRTHTAWHVSLPFVFAAHTLVQWYLQRDSCNG
eukprot:7383770-Prymnesium_polylepis.1